MPKQLIGREDTTVPVTAEMRHWTDSNSHFFLMRKVPGETLEKTWPQLSVEQKKKYAHEVVGHIAQLRKHTASKPQTVDGSPAHGMLLSPRHEFFVVNEDKEDWWSRVKDKFAHKDADWCERLKAQYPIHEGPYFLSHCDLNTCNILVHNDQISGIIDWEHSGNYPEWWEYANAQIWIQELEWNYYVVAEMKKQFGDFSKETEFAKPSLRSDNSVRNYYSRVPGNFCDCKPYGASDWDNIQEIEEKAEAVEKVESASDTGES